MVGCHIFVGQLIPAPFQKTCWILPLLGELGFNLCFSCKYTETGRILRANHCSGRVMSNSWNRDLTPQLKEFLGNLLLDLGRFLADLLVTEHV